jgi:cytochrome c peroxidase
MRTASRVCRRFAVGLAVASAFAACASASGGGSAQRTGRAERPETLQVAVLDFAATPRDPSGAAARLIRLVGRAVRAGATLVVLPEHALTGPLSGLRGREMEELVRQCSTTIAALARVAREQRVWLVTPVLEYDEETGDYHLVTVLLSDQGTEAGRFRKLGPRADRGDGVARPGGLRDLRPVRLPGGWVGILSGDDLEQGVARLAERGAGSMLVTASWEAADGVDWEAVIRDLARRHRVTLAVSNLQPARGDARRLTLVVGGDGEVVGRTATTGDGTVVLASVAEPPAEGLPLGLPPPPLPAVRAPSPESVALGRRLFFERRLSRDGRVSCATCHDPARAFTDGRTVAVGVEGRAGTRNTPTLLNAVYRSFVTWDGLVPSTPDQVRRALHGYDEMDLDRDDPVQPLDEDSGYREAFRALTGRAHVQQADVALVLTDYVRTLVSGGSAFDRYFYGGERTALGDDARRGFALFRGKAGCAACHAVGPTHALFSDGGVHNTGVGYQPALQYLGYAGDGLEVNFARFNPFKGEYVTPSLRDAARTAPYMHDGSMATLAEVVAYYDRGGTPNLFLDRRLRPLGLTAAEQAQLVAFLQSLDGAAAPEGTR